MKFNYIILILLYFNASILVKAQNMALISETDSIALFDTYLSINSTNNIAPVNYKDGLLFASAHEASFFKLFYSDLLKKPQKIKISNKFRSGLVAVYKNEIYFSGESKFTNSDQSSNLILYKGIFENFKVSKVKPLQFCKKEFTYGQPAISKNGNKMVVVTNERGLFHLLELNRNNNDEWERGDIVFITQSYFKILNPTYFDENTIYFSSNRTKAKVKGVKNEFKDGKLVSSEIYFEEGDFNIYKVVKKDGNWQLPEIVNVFNTEFDELSIVFKTPKSGYLSTFRFDNTDNIYYFELKQ
jgi:hypothetical protein